MLTTAAVIPAAGRGERMGPGLVKALRPVGGVPLVVRAVRALAVAPEVAHVVVAAPAELGEEMTDLLQRERPELSLGWQVVVGGPDRRTSVARALRQLPPEADTVLVHDGARAFVPAEVVTRVLAALTDGAAACIPALSVSDTVKSVADEVVVATLDRTTLRAAQTPQGFTRDVLARAHGLSEQTGDEPVGEDPTVDSMGDSAGSSMGDPVGDEAPGGVLVEDASVTDDAGLVERLGMPIRVVAGHEEAFKVTRPFDLLLAEALVERRTAEPTPEASR